MILLATVALANEPHFIESALSYPAVKDQPMELCYGESPAKIHFDQPSGLENAIFEYYGSCVQPSPLTRGGQAMVNLEAWWQSNNFNGDDMDHVVFEFYKADMLLKSYTFQCGQG